MTTRRTVQTPQISVVIPTYNRAELLTKTLESLARQTISPAEYEIVVINDGSTDSTADICSHFAHRVRLNYAAIGNSGISSAKNLGLFMSEAPITLFFDDDDIAEPGLLRAHIDVHSKYSEETVAVLGYTDWAPDLRITPVMHYVTEIGQFLFSYGHLTDGQLLDYTYFWGGRSSCKRRFLTQNGIFNQDFRTIIEDIELGYRLSKHGLKVIHSRTAVSHMARPVGFDDFCRRCERQGESHRRFASLHSAQQVQEYCRIHDAGASWTQLASELPAMVERVHVLEGRSIDVSDERYAAARDELYDLYRRTFEAFRLKGVVGGTIPDRSALVAQRLETTR